MAGRNKKAAVSAEEEGESRTQSESSSEMGALLRMFLEENARAEARRLAEVVSAEERAEARRLAEAKAAYDQQVALIQLQADIGEKAARAYREEQERAAQLNREEQERTAKVHREEQDAERRRDRAIASVPNYREGEDVEDFLQTAERRLGVGGIKEEDWVVVLASKLSGKLGSVWQDICAMVEDYQEVKNKVLKVCGYTPKLAAEVFFGFKSDQGSGMTADQLYHRGLQLFRRMVAPHKAGEELEFAILRGWVSAVVPVRALPT